MIRTLGHVCLKSGATLRVAALTAPAGRHSRAIRQLLAHKGQPWLHHVDLANQGETDALGTTYYVGFLGRRMVGNVMIVDDGRVGILGHVFTRPEHRRQGVCRHLLAAALRQFGARGGRALSLGTGHGSPAYWIYHSFGFRAVEPGGGQMLLELHTDALAAYFAPDRVRVDAVRWEHWAGLSMLFTQPDGDAIRTCAYGVVGPQGFEGGFLGLMGGRDGARARSRLLVTAGGSVVGAALLRPDRAWGGVHLLDLFVHPHFRGCEPRLLRALRWPRGQKVQAYLDRPSSSRARALRATGFRHEATLRGQLVRRHPPVDVLVYARGR